jgi:hypothetical protein
MFNTVLPRVLDSADDIRQHKELDVRHPKHDLNPMVQI